MKVLIGKIEKIDKSNYICDSIDLGVAGKLRGVPLRFENEPHAGDEVICFIDDFDSVAIYVPLRELSTKDFIGIARSGHKIEFTEEGEIKIYGSDEEIISIKGGEIVYKGNSNVTMKGTCTPTGTEGPFCGIPYCPFTGAPHIGSKVIGNK
jgi:hypothetical protein